MLLKRLPHHLRLKTCLLVYSFISKLNSKLTQKILRKRLSYATPGFSRWCDISCAGLCLPRDTWPRPPRSGVFPARSVQLQSGSWAPHPVRVTWPAGLCFQAPAFWEGGVETAPQSDTHKRGVACWQGDQRMGRRVPACSLSLVVPAQSSLKKKETSAREPGTPPQLCFPVHKFRAT